MSEFQEDNFDEYQLNRLGLEISSKSLSSNLYTITTFKGDDNSSASDWINKFEKLCSHFNWNNEQAKVRFSSYLSGPATNWYGLRVAPDSSFETIKEMFLLDFGDEDKLQKMRRRKLNRFEKIQAYVYDKVSLCKNIVGNFSTYCNVATLKPP